MVEILEQGAVSFLAVARRGAPDAGGAGDLERFFVVLAPEGRRPLRRLAVRRRRLPDARRRQRFFAHVDRIAAAPARLMEDVRSAQAAGRGARPRVLAVGRYALARHSDHVHLAYALARACGRGPLASALGVASGASFVLLAFRRSLPPPRRPAEGDGAAPLVPATPETLDVIGAEVALVAGGRPGDARLGIPIRRDRVGDALVGALLRRGPRPRIASFARASASRPARSRVAPAAPVPARTPERG
ncbi:MAG TPA: hypothetical protein VFL83_03660 [Anaeromyxobacter sp.]|nr:hypothetical protein [Anaeromyxobacter sp.]